MKDSCFSAVSPVIGWNQCEKCVAPFSIAQSFIAFATTSAISCDSSFSPAWTLFTARYTAFGSRSRISASLNELMP